MFVILSLTVAITILFLITMAAKKHSMQHERKYRLIVGLRKMIELTRQHRSATHYSLRFQQDKSRQIALTQEKLAEACHDLIAIAHFDNKPMYRVLEQNSKQLVHGWQRLNVSRNQLAHGKMIRHSILLVDEVLIGWIADKYNGTLDTEYSQAWQRVIDCLDALTQMRLCIEYTDTDSGKQRVARQMEVMHRKLAQLSLSTSTSIVSPMNSLAARKLEEYIESPLTDRNQEELYQLTTCLSEVIFTTYDTVVNDVIQQLYQPLPKIALA
jgi:hypothetical protein